jgi:ferredoxin
VGEAGQRFGVACREVPMPHVIDPKECTACAACEDECPAGCVSLDASELYYVVDVSACTNCGDCVAVCPADAIRPAPGE